MIEIKINFKHVKFELIIGKGVNENEERIPFKKKKEEETNMSVRSENVDLVMESIASDVHSNKGNFTIGVKPETDPFYYSKQIVSDTLGEFPLFNKELLNALAFDYEAGRLDSFGLYAMRKEGILDQKKEEAKNVPCVSPNPEPEPPVESVEYVSDTEKVQDLYDAFDDNSQFNQGIENTKARFLSEFDDDGLADITPPIEYDGFNMPCGTEIPEPDPLEVSLSENADSGKANM